MVSKLTKATSISQEVRSIVWKRDNYQCIYCHSYRGKPVAHYVSRAYQGLGIEQNIVTLCDKCHYRMDNTIHRPEMKEFVKKYLMSKYPNWNETDLKYKKEYEKEFEKIKNAN